MRLPIVLALALVLAGCTALQRGSDEPVTQASTHATTTTRPTTTTTAPPSTTTSTPPPQTTTVPTTTPPSNPTPTPPPPPQKPSDHHANQSGFVNFTPGEPFVAKLGFPVEAGAKNVTALVAITTETPLTLLPAQTDNVTVRLFDATGRDIGNRTAISVVAQDSIRIPFDVDAANLTSVGEYTLVIQITGLGDGESVGQRYVATVDVKY